VFDSLERKVGWSPGEIHPGRIRAPKIRCEIKKRKKVLREENTPPLPTSIKEKKAKTLNPLYHVTRLR